MLHYYKRQVLIHLKKQIIGLENLYEILQRTCINSAIHEIGIENVYVKHWFFYQVNLSRFWTKESYDLIVVWAGALTD
jgi:hypothetical protein